MSTKRAKERKRQKQLEEEVLYNTLDDKMLRATFDWADKDGSGYLEREECIAALTKIGSKISFEDLDTDGDNRISFEEFSVGALSHKHRSRTGSLPILHLGSASDCVGASCAPMKCPAQ